MTIWNDALRLSVLARSSIFAAWNSSNSLLKGISPGAKIRIAPSLSRAGSIFPALYLLGAKGMSIIPA
jgi:hypothetical protein